MRSLGEALRSALAEWPVGEKIIQQKIILNWEKIMGKMVAENTEKLWFHEDKQKGLELKIRMKSAVWKNEINMSRTLIKKKLNDYLGEEKIKDIRAY